MLTIESLIAVFARSFQTRILSDYPGLEMQTQYIRPLQSRRSVKAPTSPYLRKERVAKHEAVFVSYAYNPSFFCISACINFPFSQAYL